MAAGTRDRQRVGPRVLRKGNGRPGRDHVIIPREDYEHTGAHFHRRASEISAEACRDVVTEGSPELGGIVLKGLRLTKRFSLLRHLSRHRG